MVAMTTAGQFTVLPTERSPHQVDIGLWEGGASGDGAQGVGTATTGGVWYNKNTNFIYTLESEVKLCSVVFTITGSNAIQ